MERSTLIGTTVVVRSDALVGGCRWLAAAVLPWFAGAGALAQGPPGELPPAPVVVARVQEREINVGQTFVGTVVPLRTSTVGSPVEGRVIEFSVNEGDRVKAGQRLVQLRTRTLEIELAGAKAERELRQHELAELELTRPKEIEQAEARMLAGKALMDFAASRLARDRDLQGKVSNAITQDEYQEHVSAAEEARETYREKKSAWELANAGLWDKKIDQARARLAIQQETVLRLEDDIQEHTIVAPFDGYVTEEFTEMGQWIAKGSPVVQVVELESVDVEVPVPEAHVANLSVGARSRVEIGALSETMLQGEVVLVVPQADVRSRSFPVKIRVKNRIAPNGIWIKPGMFARVTLPVGDKGSALMVPKDALVLSERSTMVWVVQPEAKTPTTGRVRPVSVELGLADDEWIEIRGELQPGQLVVIEGNERISPSRPVLMTNLQSGSHTPPKSPPQGTSN